MPRTFEGWTPLHYACQSGNINLVKFLFNLPNIKFNINDGKDKHKFTLLHVASKFGHEKIVSFLLRQKDIDINPTASYSDGVHSNIYKIEYTNLTPLHLACQNGNEKVVELLITKPSIKINSIAILSRFILKLF